MSGFDGIAIVDWSARSAPSSKVPSEDAIWIAVADRETAKPRTSYHRTRTDAMDTLRTLIKSYLQAQERLLIGFDFPFGYPAGFAEAVAGQADPFAVWDWLEREIEDTADNTNNRFEVAAALNGLFPGVGPFWGRPASLNLSGLPEKGLDRDGHGLAERRAADAAVPSAQPVWKLYTTGSVGSQSLLGIPRLNALRREFGHALSVWPFEVPDAPVVLAEVYPSLLSDAVAAELAQEPGALKDELQVRLLARALWSLQAGDGLLPLMEAAPTEARQEGWILGAGAEGALRNALVPDLQPPPLRDDCFALPAGVDWVPVETALARLRGGLRPVVGVKSIKIANAAGRILARDTMALRSNPPGANSAVDGYGFAHEALGTGDQVLPLVAGRAAAGAPYRGAVPKGHAVRILTGALIPEGVDTVILQEDVTTTQTHIAFAAGIRAGANTRKAGEDIEEGAIALPAGRVLTPGDLALLTATGHRKARVHKRLTVGVLSTGDELKDPGTGMDVSTTFDANRPMLAALARRWGHKALDLGIAPDDRDALRQRLNRAAAASDVIVTSGGASAGDEDHMSAILREEGQVQTWRIAIKPGRPLALGFWNGVPVIGMPGNPVAAFVCALVFARPALSVLAGGAWQKPRPLRLPAAFSKTKKPGRSEYLRARLNDQGEVEVFASEGSGRITGLSWAEGLVALGPEARTISPGDAVDYLPFGAFGL